MADGFEGLEAYQEARKLRKRIYAMVRQLPEEERYNLASQMRRASTSMTNCIAEGHGSRSWKHNVSYLYRSRGSVCELIDDLNLCMDEAYFKIEHLRDLRKDADAVLRLINGYIRHLKGRLADESN